jgi:DNA-binding winged helix-turn-helix (wHTH) protein
VQFQFDDYMLDTERRDLHRGATPVAVEPQVFDLLVYLLRNRNRVVTKDELVASVWGGRIVSASTLVSRINAARQAVGDDGEAQRLIRAISRRGVRFIGEARATRSPPRRLGRQPYRLVVVASDELGIAGEADVDVERGRFLEGLRRTGLD